ARHQRVRTLVFLPRSDVGVAAAERTPRDLFHRALFLEGGADEERLTFDRDHTREQALAARPAEAREVGERGAAGVHPSADVFFGHDAPRLLDAGVPLVVR